MRLCGRYAAVIVLAPLGRLNTLSRGDRRIFCRVSRRFQRLIALAHRQTRDRLVAVVAKRQQVADFFLPPSFVGRVMDLKPRGVVAGGAAEAIERQTLNFHLLPMGLVWVIGRRPNWRQVFHQNRC